MHSPSDLIASSRRFENGSGQGDFNLISAIAAEPPKGRRHRGQASRRSHAPDRAPSVRIETPRPITPGSEFELAWHFSGSPRRVEVEVKLGEETLARSFQPVEVGGEAETLQPTSSPQPIRIGRPANQLIARELYRVGVRQLSVLVRDVESGRLLSTSGVQLVVSPEPIGDWCTWSAPKAVSWKEPYRVGGRIMNRGRCGLSVQRTDVLEKGIGGNDAGRPMPALNPVGTAPAGAWLDIGSERITQDWPWLGFEARGLKPELSKKLHYQFQVVVEDEFGNIYVTPSPDLEVTVKVSEKKRIFGYLDAALTGATLGLAVGAAILSVPVGLASLAWGSPVAGIQIGGALGARRLAKDPPEPDPNYSESVEFELPSAPRFAPEDSVDRRVTTLSAALHEINTLLLAADAMSLVESRWMGALMADDARAAGVHAAKHRLLLEAVRLAGWRLEQMRPAMDQTRIATRADLRRKLSEWTRNGVPRSAIELWNEAGLPGDDFASLLLAQGPEAVAEGGVAEKLKEAINRSVSLSREMVLADPDIANRAMARASRSEDDDVLREDG